MVVKSRARVVRALVMLTVVVMLAGLGQALPVRAATLTVPGGDVAALIAAITTANASQDADTIVLAAGSTYILTSVNNGRNGLPLITSPITIVGNGATIKRSTTVGTPDFRILEVAPGAMLMLQHVTISGGSTEVGGGVYSVNGTLTLTNSTVSGNSATSIAGGIYHSYGTLTLIDSSVSGNSATTNAGGIASSDGTLTLTNSTVSGNTATGDGGGIFHRDGLMTLTNSTVSGNSASYGGGIYDISVNSMVTLTNSTVSGNNATDDGGGILGIRGLFILTNTLVAANSATTGPDIWGSVTGTFNLIGDGTDMFVLTHGTSGNQVGTGAAPIDPLLGPLADNGGPTLTMLPSQGSPAIDAADTAAGPATDQRGVNRPQGAASDIGAVEVVLMTHAELCAQTQQAIRAPAAARSACAMLVLARAADQHGNVVVEQVALTNYRLLVRSAESRRYVSARDAAKLIAWSQLL